MCEQTPVDYKDGDIVWVKLGPCWWPGEVQDLNKLPSEWVAEFKKPPIAAVRFFDEDAYEYVKSIDKIYSYNCTKKNEFIKKGLDLYRAKNTFMDKFPSDVITAERRTNGDPNIIDSPLFSPEKKPNFAALIFGSPKAKKGPTKKSSIGSVKKSTTSTNASPSTSSKSTPVRLVTHPRFLGRDDHEVRILVQTPDKTEENEEEEKESTYNCSMCGFTTSRIDVIVLHNKSHIQGVYNTPTSTLKKGKKSPVKKGKKELKMTKSKTSSIAEDLALLEKGLSISAESSDEEIDEEFEDEPKRKRKKNKRKPKKAPPKKEPEVKTDIRVDLLAEWDEDDSEEEAGGESALNTSSNLDTDHSDNKTDESKTKADKIEDTKKNVEDSKKKVEDTKKEIDKSCFDFDEEEEAESGIIGTSIGRKIPRVIPPAEKQKNIDQEPDVDEAALPSIVPETDKPKSINPDINEANLPTAEDDINRSEQINEINSFDANVSDKVLNESEMEKITDKDEAGSSDEKLADPDEEAFKDILDSTSVPDLPEIPHSLKYEQNFPNSKTIKFPDKPDQEVDCDEKVSPTKSEIKEGTEAVATTKLINPKKRFVKSFEDFELQWNNEQKRLGLLEEQDSNHSTNVTESEEDKITLEQKNATATTHSEEKDAIATDTTINTKLEEKEPDLEKEPELDLFNLVEVSKLKTQLMTKLENAEKLQPFEQTRNKRSESSRGSYSLRERPEKQRNDKADDSVSPKRIKLDSIVDNKADLQLSTESRNEVDMLISDKIDDSEQIHEDTSTVETAQSAVEKSIINETQNDVTDVQSRKPPKPRRLSVKIPEVKETSDTEQSELSEFNEIDIMVQQAQVMEVKPNSEVLHVQEVATEISSIELQPINENLILNFKVEDKDDIHKDHKENDSKSKCDDDKMDIDNENQSTVNEVEVGLEQESSSSIELDVKHSEISQFSVVDDKAMDDLISIQFSNENSQHSLVTNIQSENTLSNEDIPQSPSVSFSLEKSSTNAAIENKDSEDLSALTTLATVSELSTNLDIERSNHDEKSKVIEGSLVKTSEVVPPSLVNNGEQSKVVESGNLTFVTEVDLADGQVEIANVSVGLEQNKAKPITLSNFSVDFPDPSQPTSNKTIHATSLETPTATTITKTNKRKHVEDMDRSEIIERSLEKVFEEGNHGFQPTIHSSKTRKIMSAAEKTRHQKINLESQIPSLLVCTSKQSDVKTVQPVLPKKSYLEKVADHPEYTSSSKLLEILTDGKPKTVQAEVQKPHTAYEITSTKPIRKSEPKSPAFSIASTIIPVHKNISKFDSKNSKFVIKSAISPKGSATIPISKSNNKPIILSEKIIKPVSETENVSVQKVTSTRINQEDVEDIDTFIIRKQPKKVPAEIETNESVPAVLPQPAVKKGARGKAKILQQTIIKPAAEVIQPTNTTLTTTATSQPIDDNMFDINSMPIVLGDQILTAENIESMPVILSDTPQPTATITKNIINPPTTNVVVTTKSHSEQVKILNKTTASSTTQPVLVKTYPSQKITKGHRLYPAGATKIVKSNPAIITRTGKSDKFIIVPPGSSSSSPGGSRYTVGKKPAIVKRSTPVILPPPASTAKVQSVQSSEPTGNKIMIVTNQQGQQSRVLLTPAQQKLLGYQPTSSKLVKSTLKGNILQKVSNTKTAGLPSLTTVGTSKVSNMISHAIVNSKGEIISTAPSQSLITSDGQVLMSVKSSQVRGLKADTPKGKKIQMQSQKVSVHEGLSTLKNSPIPAQQKTIVIKNQQGQIVKKFQGTDDALLEQQVAEQVQAIKASGSFSAMKAKQEIGTPKIKPALRRSYAKKTSMDASKITSKPQMVLNTANVAFSSPKLQKPESSVPPLAPISPKRSDTLLLPQLIPKMEENKVDASLIKETPKAEQIQQKPVNQLIIQDALGNQTTITEGQILALPSGETIDGHPQSYMLVTLDESGNLAPLNNEALLSLDPNLCLGGDLSNMVLQIDDGSNAVKQGASEISKTPETNTTAASEALVPTLQNNEIAQKEKQQSNVLVPVPVQEQVREEKPPLLESVAATNQSTLLDTSQQNLETVQTVTCSIGSDPNQQLIITGDPISTQKFIESLAEGNPDLANLLASAEGNILIQTDEQQILINTDAENPMLLPVNAAENLGVMESSESNSNPIFAAQPSKNQDILAAALADTDVFQQEQTSSPSHTKVPQSQLSPNGGLYPTGVANVLGTTLTLSSPIMTPLEVPSTNNKKIPDEESDILTTEVAKNVDLPITITDPNISQTVAQQQVASLIASELTSNLELPLTISDQSVALTSAEMNSPTYVYSLPTLDEAVDIHPKTFSGPISMPLLTEEPHETSVTETIPDDIESKVEVTEKSAEDKETPSTITDIDSVSKSNDLFDSSDSIKDSDGLQSTNRTFLGATIETDEGLCALGGAMCSSLSEPPPDMFDLSIVNSGCGPDNEIKESIEVNIPETDIVSSVSESTTFQSKPIDCDMSLSTIEQSSSIEEEYNKFDNYDTDCRTDGTPLSSIPLNSESSSPAVNIDENSCEIPVQPQIVTDLSSSSFDTHETTDSADFDSSKRISSDDSIENEKKKSKFD